MTNYHKFGMIVPETADENTIVHQAKQLGGIQWWYNYTPAFIPTPGFRLNQVCLIKTGASNQWQQDLWIEEIKAKKYTNTHITAIIGNEPNNQDQDGTTPQEYADEYHRVVSTICRVDPAATIVGPAILNWSASTVGTGSGFTVGKDWFQKMLLAYRASYADEPIRLDAVMLHTSVVDWESLPMVHPDRDIQQIRELREFLDQDPELKGIPIWVELAVLWAFDDLEYVKQADGTWKINPVGNLRVDLLTDYVNKTVEAMTQMGIQRWFFYSNFSRPEPYDLGASGGISFFDAPSAVGSLTSAGRAYKRLLQKSKG